MLPTPPRHSPALALGDRSATLALRYLIDPLPQQSAALVVRPSGSQPLSNSGPRRVFRSPTPALWVSPPILGQVLPQVTPALDHLGRSVISDAQPSLALVHSGAGCSGSRQLFLGGILLFCFFCLFLFSLVHHHVTWSQQCISIFHLVNSLLLEDYRPITL